MTRLDPADQLAALVRAQIDGLRQRAAGARANRRPGGQAASGHESASLAANASQQIRAIADSDPDRHAKALRVFLESVLASELGTQVVNDPGFSAMVDHVQQRLLGDPDLSAAATEAAEALLKSAKR